MESLVLHHPHLKTLIISIFLASLLFFKSDASDFDGVIYSRCITTDSDDAAFQSNLQTLFSKLTSSSLRFFNSTAGKPPNKAYGLYLCSFGSPLDACLACVRNITFAADGECKEFYGYGQNQCMVHYSNTSFFGTSNNNNSLLVTGFATGDHVAYVTTLRNALNRTVASAIAAPGGAATGAYRVDGDGNETVYAIAQCTQDLDQRNCSGCLNAALVQLINYTYSNYPIYFKSRTDTFPSCQLRYDNVTFFAEASSIRTSAATVPPFLVAALGLFFGAFIC